MSSIRENLARVREQIHKAAAKAGRDADSVSLMAVSKNHPVDAILEAMDAGQKLFGENRVQEAKEKFSPLDREFELHMIGHLQRNKVQDAVSICSCVQSVDAIKTIRKISESAMKIGSTVDVLLEVNTSKEATKSGVEDRLQLDTLLNECGVLGGIRVRGLMTMAPFTEDKDKIRASFVMLRTMFEDIGSAGTFSSWDTLSMGMSSDFEIAIEEGSTLVRVGTAIFGGRT